MFFRHSSHKLLIPLVAVFILFVLSYRPKYQLRSEMPSEFFPERAATTQNSVDQKIAWAYWETAQMDVQWKYGHGHPLPTDPPAEFRISATALGPAASDPAIRILYWRRLQQVWVFPETWNKVYELDWSWM